MDINRVELRGQVYGQVTFRKNKDGGDWVTFSVMTKELLPEGGLSSVKTTFNSVCVFSEPLVKKIKALNVKVGDRIWLRGKLFTKQGRNAAIYTSTLITDFEIAKKVKDADDENLQV